MSGIGFVKSWFSGVIPKHFVVLTVFFLNHLQGGVTGVADSHQPQCCVQVEAVLDRYPM